MRLAVGVALVAATALFLSGDLATDQIDALKTRAAPEPVLERAEDSGALGLRPRT